MEIFKNTKYVKYLCGITFFAAINLWFMLGEKLMNVGNKLYIIILITSLLVGVSSLFMLLFLIFNDRKK